jgi:hypothetical protein
LFNGNGRVCCWGDRSGTYNQKQEVQAEVMKYYLPFPSNLFQKFGPSNPNLRRPAKVKLKEDIDLDDL